MTVLAMADWASLAGVVDPPGEDEPVSVVVPVELVAMPTWLRPERPFFRSPQVAAEARRIARKAFELTDIFDDDEGWEPGHGQAVELIDIRPSADPRYVVARYGVAWEWEVP